MLLNWRGHGRRGDRRPRLDANWISRSSIIERRRRCAKNATATGAKKISFAVVTPPPRSITRVTSLAIRFNSQPDTRGQSERSFDQSHRILAPPPRPPPPPHPRPCKEVRWVKVWPGGEPPWLLSNRLPPDVSGDPSRRPSSIVSRLFCLFVCLFVCLFFFFLGRRKRFVQSTKSAARERERKKMIHGRKYGSLSVRNCQRHLLANIFRFLFFKK